MNLHEEEHSKALFSKHQGPHQPALASIVNFISFQDQFPLTSWQDVTYFFESLSSFLGFDSAGPGVRVKPAIICADKMDAS